MASADAPSITRYLDVPEWVHDLVLAPLLLLLMVAVCVHRARALSRRFGGPADPRREALLADPTADTGDGYGDGDSDRDAVPLVQRCEQAAAAAELAVAVAVLVCVALPGTPGDALAPARRTALAGAACTALAWTVCLWLVFREVGAEKQPGRSLRLWWLANAIPRSLLLRSDIIALGETAPAAVTVALALRVASFVPTLFLAGCGLFQMDSWTRGGAAAALDGDETADRFPAPPGVAAPHAGDARLRAAARRKLVGDAVASFWDKLTFRWCNALLVLGAQRPLEHDDLFTLPHADGAMANQRRLEAAWRTEHLRTPGGRKPSFLRALARAFGGYFAVTGLIKVINDLAVFVGPYMIAKITSYMEGTTQEPISTVYLYTLGMFVGATVQSLAVGQYFLRGFRLGLRMRAGIGQLVYHKALELSYSSRTRFGVGAIVSYMQIDAGKLGDSMPYLHLIWSAWLQVVLATWMLYQQVGPSGFAGIAVLILLMPLNTRVAKMQMNLTKETMRMRDRRVKFTNEVVSGVRIIKFFAWEKPFLSAIDTRRADELQQVRRNAIWGAFSTFLWGATPLFVTVATFVLYVALGNDLTASKAFTSLSLFNVLRFPLNAIPSSITRVVDVLVVTRRLGDFLAAEETQEHRCASEAEWARALETRRPGYTRYCTPPSAAPPAGDAAAAAGTDHGDEAEPVVVIDGGEFAWPATDVGDVVAVGPGGAGVGGRRSSGATRAMAEVEAGTAARPVTLRGIDLRIRPHTLTIVAGQVGSGKSSLLAALTNEIPLIRGHVAVRGALAFCAQEPWIQNMSLRDNVLFGKPYDEARYEMVVRACALAQDLESLPAGDATEIGERGINLSGGQKARVALARACYADADVYLLDDVLSAVDAEVGAHIVRECLTRLLAHKTVILVTHHVQWLRLAHHAVIMRDGAIESQGPPSALSLARHLSGLAGVAEAVEGSAEAINGATAASSISGENAPNGTGAGASHAPANPEAATVAGAPAAEAPKRDVSVMSSGARSVAGAGAGGDAKLMRAEGRERGRVKLAVWRLYFIALGAPALLWLVALYSLSQALQVGSSAWLTVWSSAGEQERAGGPSARSAGYYVAVYAALTLGAAGTVYVRAIVVALASVNAGRRLHNAALNALLASPMTFFDTTPLGQILNRFSTDQQVVDVQLRMTTQQLFLCFFNIAGILVVVLYATPYMGVALAPMGFVYYTYARYYRHSSREVQRLDSVSKSPIYAAFSETLTGTGTIKAFDRAQSFIARSCARFDHNLRANFCSFAANRWLAVRLEFIGNAFVGLSALFLVFEAHTGRMSAGVAGMSLSYALVFTDYLNWLIRVFTMLETQMVGVERLDQYCKLEPEQKATALQLPPPGGWPQAGAISLDAVCLRYRPELPLVLDGLTCQVRAGEKVGIVGRTGSGKSSLLLALYRMVPLTSGTIRIDGIDVASLDLSTLRSKLSIIPQDPTLFSGTVRSNLDPFHDHTDEDVWGALRRCRLASAVSAHVDGMLRAVPPRLRSRAQTASFPSRGLNMAVDSGGSNLSVGQRQLLCLGRALLRRTRILVLDEATASVDHETDLVVQETLRADAADKTTLTVAHRIATIMQSDRVLVLANGRVVESGPPTELAVVEGGVFASLLQRSSTVDRQ